MRYLTPQDLLETIATTLEQTVLPRSENSEARGQILAASGLLRNLATRVVEDPDAVSAELRQLAVPDTPRDSADCLLRRSTTTRHHATSPSCATACSPSPTRTQEGSAAPITTASSATTNRNKRARRMSRHERQGKPGAGSSHDY